MAKINKCIGDDTKAAARQSLNCIKNKKIKHGEKRFSIWRMECGMWLWNRDSEFTKWQHPAMWYGMTCHWIRPNVRHIGILHLVSISTHHRSRHVILYQSAKFYSNRTTLGKKMTSCRFSRWRMSAILDCRNPIMGPLKSPVKLT